MLLPVLVMRPSPILVYITVLILKLRLNKKAAENRLSLPRKPNTENTTIKVKRHHREELVFN